MVIPSHCCKHRHPQRHGFNLLEVTISTLLIGVLLVASMQTVGSLVLRHGLQTQQDIKSLLTHDLLSEIYERDFEEPTAPSATLGIDNGETPGDRQSFDDIDDYHLWSESSVHDPEGNEVASFAGFARSVQVQYVDPADLSPSIAPTVLKQITITVTGPDGKEASLVALRDRFGPQEVMPGLYSTYVRSVRVRLDIDGSSSILESATGIPNQVAVEDSP